MALFKCNSCNQEYEDYYPPDDTCIKCNKGTIHIIQFHKESTMTAITPVIKLHTCYQYQGTYINALILNYQNNNYHLHGGTSDTIHVFTESIGIYVLTTNKCLGYVGLNCYMAPEPDPLNSVFLHNPQEVKEVLGNKWESASPESLVRKLINYLC